MGEEQASHTACLSDIIWAWHKPGNSTAGKHICC